MIFLAGDTHRKVNIAKMYRLKEYLTKDDYVIILGDFGLFWEDYVSSEEKELIDFYNSFPCPVLWVDGNHENFTRIGNLRTEEKFGSIVGFVSNNIFHLRRGNVYTIDNKTFFTMGGAESIDRGSRLPMLSWWPQELPSQEEYQNALNNLQKCNYTVDYILTHDAPLSFYYEAYVKVVPNDLNIFLEDEINNKVNYKHWYFGHHHIDEIIDDKHTAVYETIRTIE